jgi:methylated-DNA-[protein]-cysteine S-methyltransferase
MTAPPGAACAYVCRGSVCGLPVTAPGELAACCAPAAPRPLHQSWLFRTVALDSRRRPVCHRLAHGGRRRAATTAWNCSLDPRSVPQLSLHTPVGDLTVSEADGRIVAIDWGWGRDQTETPLLTRARARLDAYFDGEPVTFDLPLAPDGTPYRQRVWAALCRIPSGATRTYGEIAREAGGSARSVGGANAVNPIPILIPCHRVVAAGGPGGYSGGDGLVTKRALLDLEARAQELIRSRAAG